MKTRVFLRQPSSEDAADFLASVRRSRVLHRGWVSPPPTRQAFLRWLQGISANDQRRHLVVHKATGELVGVINVSNIVRGHLHSAFLGYYAFADYAGQGLMKEGMRLVLRDAFGKLKLHRVEANIQPDNKASLALVQRCGFVREGYSRRYLKVAGRWRDHERWALLAEDFARAAGP